MDELKWYEEDKAKLQEQYKMLQMRIYEMGSKVVDDMEVVDDAVVDDSVGEARTLGGMEEVEVKSRPASR